MANRAFILGTEAFLEGNIDALTDTLACAMFTAAYTPNTNTDQFYSTPIASGGLIGTKITLTTVTGSGGTLSADNTVFPSVTGGSTVTQLVVFKDTGTNGTSKLIGLVDTAAGLPLLTDGNNVTVAWASGQVFTLFESLAEEERDRTLRARMKELLKWLGKRKWSETPEGLFFPEPSIVRG